MLMMPCKTDSKLFSFKDNTFSAFASDLPKNWNPGQVYDDACDVGFTIISARTGKPAVFALTKTVTDDGDTLSWVFKCVTHGLTHLACTIYND